MKQHTNVTMRSLRCYHRIQILCFNHHFIPIRSRNVLTNCTFCDYSQIQAVGTHPSEKKALIIRSPRGLMASSGIRWKSSRLSEVRTQQACINKSASHRRNNGLRRIEMLTLFVLEASLEMVLTSFQFKEGKLLKWFWRKSKLLKLCVLELHLAMISPD